MNEAEVEVEVNVDSAGDEIKANAEGERGVCISLSPSVRGLVRTICLLDVLSCEEEDERIPFCTSGGVALLKDANDNDRTFGEILGVLRRFAAPSLTPASSCGKLERDELLSNWQMDTLPNKLLLLWLNGSVLANEEERVG